MTLRYFFSVQLFVLLSLCACGKIKEPVNDDEAIRFHLNQGNYDQAINLLKAKLQANPNDHRSSLLLASAYSGSVGINTLDCFEVLRSKLFDQPLGNANAHFYSETIEFLSSSQANVEEKDKSFELRQQQAVRTLEKELLKFFRQGQDVLEIAFLLPHIAIEPRERLNLALAILADIPEESPLFMTTQLYSGIIAIVQFMNFFRDAVPPSLQENKSLGAWYLNVYCQLDFGILLPNLSRSVNYLGLAFLNLKNAKRQSSNPTYDNFELAQKNLDLANRYYQNNIDVFEFIDWSMRFSRPSVCEE